LAVTACLLLAPAGLALLGLGILSNEPDSDTGEQESTAAIVALLTVGAAVVLLCLPANYLFARNRFVAGALVTAAGIGAAIVTLYAA